jgi:hypothetical protein
MKRPMATSAGWARNQKAIGIALVVLSGLLWCCIPLVHMLSISGWWKGAIDAAIFVVAEIAFWVGSVLAGKEFVRRLWRFWETKPAGEADAKGG